jgi:hypothetical protein
MKTRRTKATSPSTQAIREDVRLLRLITDQHSTAGRAPSRVGITRTVAPGRSAPENPCKPSAPREARWWRDHSRRVGKSQVYNDVIRTVWARPERQSPLRSKGARGHARAGTFYHVQSHPGSRPHETEAPRAPRGAKSQQRVSLGAPWRPWRFRLPLLVQRPPRRKCKARRWPRLTKCVCVSNAL